MADPGRARRPKSTSAQRVNHGDCGTVVCTMWADVAGGTALRGFRTRLRAFLDAQGVDPQLAADAISAAGEALANTVEHAFRETPGRMEMDACICSRHRVIALQIRDTGSMKPRQQPREGGGFGFQIMRKLADTFSVRFGAVGTIVDLSFRLDREKG